MPRLADPLPFEGCVRRRVKGVRGWFGATEVVFVDDDGVSWVLVVDDDPGAPYPVRTSEPLMRTADGSVWRPDR